MFKALLTIFKRRPIPPTDVLYSPRSGAVFRRGNNIEQSIGPDTTLAVWKAVEADRQKPMTAAVDFPLESTQPIQRPPLTRKRAKS